MGDGNKKAPSDGASAQIASSFDSFHELKYRRIWHLAFTQVAGLHRADPSTALDKVSYKIIVISLSDFTAHVNRYSIKKTTEFVRILLYNLCIVAAIKGEEILSQFF